MNVTPQHSQSILPYWRARYFEVSLPTSIAMFLVRSLKTLPRRKSRRATLSRTSYPYAGRRQRKSLRPFLLLGRRRMKSVH